MVALVHRQMGRILHPAHFYLLHQFLADFFLSSLSLELRPAHSGGSRSGRPRADPVANRIQNDRPTTLETILDVME